MNKLSNKDVAHWQMTERAHFYCDSMIQFNAAARHICWQWNGMVWYTRVYRPTQHSI